MSGQGGDKDARAGLEAIWREAAEKGIAEGIDWPRVVLDLFKELDRLRDVQPSIGHVQRASFGEWQSTCAAPHCGWYFGRSKTQEDAEKRLRGHASLAHPPRIPVRALPPTEATP